MILVAGYVHYPPGALAKLKGAMEKVLKATRAEPGCINYDFAVDVGEPDRLIIFERWRDAASLEAHGKSAHVAEWRAAASSAGPAERKLSVWEVDEGRSL